MAALTATKGAHRQSLLTAVVGEVGSEKGATVCAGADADGDLLPDMRRAAKEAPKSV